ncbi:MAG: NAD-dependent dehydratase [Phenylobacterium zucineum]|nr:MAG: NAD-dependent dehydratase [Phenylobacterium zucineum]
MTHFTVIGAGGFVGSRVAAALTARGEVVFRPPRAQRNFQGQDLGRVIYCAGLTGDFLQRPFDTVEAHVSLISNILEVCRFERLVYLSSTRVYDSLSIRGGLESDVLELDPALPRNVYDLSKALGENLCLNNSDGRACVARLSNVFDVDDKAGGFLSDLLRRARQEADITLPASPMSGRDYIHVADAVDALMVLATGEAPGIYNVAGGRPVLNRELIDVFGQAGRGLTLTGQDVPAPQPRCDITRLKQLGVTPRDAVTVIADILARPDFLIN